MTTGDNHQAPARQSSPADLLVIGAGIMGLWAAVFARRAGLSVQLVDAQHPGAGASGGLLGALMPHMPDRWSDNKQLQFDALVSLEDEIARLESVTGLSAGYRRAGRLIPLPKPHLRDIALRHEQEALTNWNGRGRQFQWSVRDPASAAGLIAPDAVAAGFVQDTLAARVDPRGLIGLLLATLRPDTGFTISEGTEVVRLDLVSSSAVLADGSTITFGHAVICNGTRSAGLLEQLWGPLHRPAVSAVKGQAALLSASLPADTPVIYLDGLYVVPHEGGRVAIGSTSEVSFDDPLGTDGQLDILIDRARALVPALAEAPVLERWAGLRPKAILRDPMVGWLPDHAAISVLTGGFKVSFGVAHHLAAALVTGIASGTAVSGLPPSYAPERHRDEARGLR